MTFKSSSANFGNAVRQGNGGKAAATSKGTIFYFRDTFRNDYGSDASAIEKETIRYYLQVRG